MARFRSHHGLAIALAAAATFVGCLLVAPLGDPPATSTSTSATTSTPPTSTATAGGAGGAGGTGGAGGGGTGGSTDSDGQAGCNKNSDCVPGSADEPRRCREDHVCVNLKSDDNACPLVYGNVPGKPIDDNAIVFGAFAGLNQTQPERSPILYAYRLALDEFNGDAHGGLPIPGAQTRRPLVMVICNSDPKEVDAGMKHLAGDGPDAVGVSAVLASMKPGDLARAYANYKPGQIFFMNPGGSNRALTGTAHNGLMWHMLGQPSDLAPAYVELVRLAEQYVRDSRGVGSRPVRVALVSTTEAFDSELSDVVVPALRFNEKDATANGENYLGVTVDLANPKPQEDALRICQFAPDIMVSTAGEVFSQQGGVLQYIEQVWAVCRPQEAGVSALARPFYVLSPINFGSLNNVRAIIESQLKGAVGAMIDPQAHRRFVGISAAGAADSTLYNQFFVRLQSHFMNQGDPDSENFYDAFYFLAYAMYGAGSVAKLTGPAIADGMVRLIDGTIPFDVGPLPITDVFTALSVQNASIRLNGTLGPANFTRQTGARVDVGSVYCFKANSDSTVALQSQVLRYDPTPDDRSPGRFTGDFATNCFPGFLR